MTAPLIGGNRRYYFGEKRRYTASAGMANGF
jgi:hypothetical protein